MNHRMWANPQVQANAAALRTQGRVVIDPGTGPLASPDEGAGQGRMQEPETIVAHAGRLLEAPGKLRGRRIVVTAGPTREPLDPVRYLSNHSTGKMGVALAAAAWRRGAEVVVIHGPMISTLQRSASVRRRSTTQEIADAVRAGSRADVLVIPPRPRPPKRGGAKIKKRGNAPEPIVLTENVDILASTRDARKAGMIAVGFALETDDLLENAAAKLEKKGLDLVVANSAREAGAGFGYDTNRVTILGKDGASDALPLLPKTEVADLILDRIEALL
jgi:phosphopantothenoylcysteine decarboxylase/phosphopantothenate--cysteine ligase